MKRCFKCNEVKSLDLFYKHPKMKDGHLNKCKECTKNDVRMDRINSPNARLYDKKRWYENEERRKIVLERSRKWAEEKKERKSAHTKVHNAIRDGRLKKTPCVICGSNYRIHGHHEDYTKPLDVIWLCAIHHQQHHHGTIDAKDKSKWVNQPVTKGKKK